jgi:hypothetical protein
MTISAEWQVLDSVANHHVGSDVPVSAGERRGVQETVRAISIPGVSDSLLEGVGAPKVDRVSRRLLHSRQVMSFHHRCDRQMLPLKPSNM